MDASRRQLADVLVELADTLVAGFDPLDHLTLLATRCVELLGVDAAGVLIADSHELPRMATGSSEEACSLEVLELQVNEGAGVDCLDTGSPVRCPDLAEAHTRWPHFAPSAQASGFSSVHALPLRLRAETIGGLTLFATTLPAPGDGDLVLGQSLADVATIGLLHERNSRHGDRVVEQLQGALDSRVVIEQAKGILAERHQIDLDTAFSALRTYARGHNRRLRDVAHAVVRSPADVADLLTARQPR